MFSFCYFYIFFAQKIFTFFVSLCKGVVGFLPVPTYKESIDIIIFQCYNNFSYLEHNNIKEQETVLH